jgi:hypothetical protein
MGILFKTYNKKHQLHLYNEIWVLQTKAQLNDLVGLFPKSEAAKLKINPIGTKIELELNGVILDCKDTKDLKAKFGHFVDLKEKFQKTTPKK